MQFNATAYREHDLLHRILTQNKPSEPTIGAVFGDSVNLPDVFYVDSGNGNDLNDGRDPAFPLATVDAANNKCTASQNDVILVQPGHSETLSAAIALDVIGVQVIGVGDGLLRPQFTIDTADVNGFAISAANVTLDNLYFNERTATPTGNEAYVDVSAANVKLLRLHFDVGADDLDSITIQAGGDSLEIGHCRWVTTADGPDVAIRIEAAGVDLLWIHHCLIDGGTVANGFDEGHIVSAAAHTNCVLEHNTFHAMASGVGGIQFTAAATGIIQHNNFGLGTLGQMLDPGSCMCIENYEQDAVDESAVLFPARNPTESLNPDAGVFLPGLGFRAQNALALTQGASPSQDLFTITGLCLINLFIGEVTTAITNASIDVTIQIKTSGEDMFAITLIDNDAAGTLYWVPGDPLMLLNTSLTPAINTAALGTMEHDSTVDRAPHTIPILIGQTGQTTTLEHVIAGTPANSDVIEWTLWYYKLEASALIASA